MCLQAYYNYNQEEIELDLLKEIEEVGVEKWNEKVEIEKEKVELESKIGE